MQLPLRGQTELIQKVREALDKNETKLWEINQKASRSQPVPRQESILVY